MFNSKNVLVPFALASLTVAACLCRGRFGDRRISVSSAASECSPPHRDPLPLEVKSKALKIDGTGEKLRSRMPIHYRPAIIYQASLEYTQSHCSSAAFIDCGRSNLLLFEWESLARCQWCSAICSGVRPSPTSPAGHRRFPFMTSEFHWSSTPRPLDSIGFRWSISEVRWSTADSSELSGAAYITVILPDFGVSRS
jgi:hypothetical protein